MNQNQLPEKVDTLIIGGGIIGLCAAFFLQKTGRKILLLERRELGYGSSTGNAGLIVPSHFVPLAAPGAILKGLKWMFNPESPFYIKPRLDWDLLSWLWQFNRASTATHVRKSAALLLQLHLKSKALFQEISALPRMDFGLTPQGLLMLSNTASGVHELAELVDQGQKIGLAPRLLTPAEMAELDPGLQTSATGGAYFPEDAHLDPGQFVSKLSRYLREKGVVLRESLPATDVVTANGRISGVVTPNGTINADEVVLAGGAFSPEMAAKLRFHLPVQPGKGYSVTLNRTPQFRTPLILEEARVAVTPMGDKIRFAGTMELAGYDPGINHRRVQAILKAIPKYLPNIDLTSVEKAEQWVGFRPCSPDGLPYLGRSSTYRNLVIATGHAMIGVSLAPVTGKMVAGILQEETLDLPIELLDPDRFN